MWRTLKSSDGKGMVSEQDPCETGKQDLGAGENGKRAPTGSAGKPDNLSNGLRKCWQTMRRAMGKERLGFLVDGKRWVSASYAEDIFLMSATKRDLEAMIRDITKELEAVGLGLGAIKTQWSSYRAKPVQTLHVNTDTTKALDLSGSSWASIRHRLNQGTASMRKLAPIFKSKCVNGGRKMMMMMMIDSAWMSRSTSD